MIELLNAIVRVINKAAEVATEVVVGSVVALVIFYMFTLVVSSVQWCLNNPVPIILVAVTLVAAQGMRIIGKQVISVWRSCGERKL